jgi:hypothetical protein
MARGPLRFKQGDVERAVKAARKAGVPIGKIEIDAAGKISIVVGVPRADDTPADEAPEANSNTWDRFLTQ